MPDAYIFCWIVSSAADAVVFNPNDTKTISANGVSIFFINGKPTFINEGIKFSNPPFRVLILSFKCG